MSGIMLDSTNWEAIATAIKDNRTWRNMRIRAAGGYMDGPKSQWPETAWAEISQLGVQMVRYSVTGLPGADVYDCENGDLSVISAAHCVQKAVQSGRHDSNIYMDRTRKPQVVNTCGALGLRLDRDYGLVVATLDDTFNDLDGTDLRHQPGVRAVQYLGAKAAGIDVDVNVLIGDWPAPHWMTQVSTLAANAAESINKVRRILGDQI